MLTLLFMAAVLNSGQGADPTPESMPRKYWFESVPKEAYSSLATARFRMVSKAPSREGSGFVYRTTFSYFPVIFPLGCGDEMYAIQDADWLGKPRLSAFKMTQKGVETVFSYELTRNEGQQQKLKPVNSLADFLSRHGYLLGGKASDSAQKLLHKRQMLVSYSFGGQPESEDLEITTFRHDKGFIDWYYIVRGDSDHFRKLMLIGDTERRELEKQRKRK